ncbi:AbrB/MazE/SpoVT family DNA-binding domain-containing protein [Rhodopseudomonas palustris]|uniref:AbrB/MazE/SpoVT family DNA-binding domain-containing protein n=1 Tax=Rhodopseudomonas palustris TaxID=1076 RepID=A0A418V2L4_RHOPL|nr:AbrB/MazE/SpoVT family DNA-binding domain-containing protein [Rhodopseudomonas palustris]RJF70270.1 AbrB/MazE/SpoVT family DNA-binding domain-containing protein [Rhodopseudomonas palustris]
MKGLVSQWGNSAALRLPKPILEDLKIAPGSEVEMWVEAGELRVCAAPRRARYRLEDLIAQMDPANEPPTVDWGPDRGAEIIDDDYSRGLIVPGPDGAPVRVEQPVDAKHTSGDVRRRRR